MGITHSVYGGSVAHRFLTCAAYPAMSEGKEDEPTDDAQLGNAAHDLVEFCLKSGLNTTDCLGLVFNDITVDNVMADAAQLYVSYIRDLCRKYNVEPMVEKSVVMLSVSNEVFGTADCIIIVGDWLFVIDYKHGYDVVDVVNNAQCIHYTISALDTLNLWSTIKYVRTVIVQPHSYHVDGSIRHHDYRIDELLNWRERFRNAFMLSKSGNAKPVAGEHCKRCPASANCYARFMRTVELVFNNGELTVESLLPLFYEMATVKDHLERVAKEVEKYAKKGNVIEGYKLVKVTPRTVCIDEDSFVKDAMFLSGRDEHEFYNRKLKSKADCKRLIANDQTLIDDYFKSPETTELKLVPMSDSKPAVSIGKAVGVFTPVTPTTKPTAKRVFTSV